MSTYSASHLANGSSRPLDGRLGATVRVLYHGYCGSPITAQDSGYDQFPPATNGEGTKHPISDMAPPLLAEEDGFLNNHKNKGFISEDHIGRSSMK
jgi:hypothetical protein